MPGGDRSFSRPSSSPWPSPYGRCLRGGELAEWMRGGQPDEAMLLLQREVESARTEGRKDRLAGVSERSPASFAQELKRPVRRSDDRAGGNELGQVRGDAVQRAARARAATRRRRGAGQPGQARRSDQRVFEVGREHCQGLEQDPEVTESPGRARRDVLAELLAQMFSREHYALQYGFHGRPSGRRRPHRASAGPVDAKFPARELSAHGRGDRRGAAANLRRAFVRDVKLRDRRDRQAVHPARRRHLRLRPHVHPGGERLLRDDHPGRVVRRRISIRRRTRRLAALFLVSRQQPLPPLSGIVLACAGLDRGETPGDPERPYPSGGDIDRSGSPLTWCGTPPRPTRRKQVRGGGRRALGRVWRRSSRGSRGQGRAPSARSPVWANEGGPPPFAPAQVR